MERMTIDEIARAVGCPGSYPGAVDVISTDSRSLPEGCLFVALEGERFDGTTSSPPPCVRAPRRQSRTSGATTAPAPCST